ncbi:MAG: DUF2489 domain-containing protein [Pseudomonas sp.]|nr:DUF2489 domain-containing protein [Pseudomonas sp.]
MSLCVTRSKKLAVMIRAHAAVRKNTKNVTVSDMQTLSSAWLIAATVCILALAAYAAFLWRRVWQSQQQRLQQHAAQKAQRHDDLIVLANGFLSEQMPWAEGCIRIKVILDHYDANLGMQADYQVLQTVFTATEQIPSHDAWRELSSAEKKPFQQLLTELELQHKQDSVRAVQQLLSHLQR